MRIIIALLITLLILNVAIAQAPSKKEMQAQMLEAVNEINRQITDLEKQIEIARKENPGEVKDLEDQVTILKKQVEMMRGVNKSMSGMSEKLFTQAAQKEALVPAKDAARINSLPKRTLNDAELFSFVKNTQAEVEKLIPAIERTEALKIYNETKEKYNSVDVSGNAASGCWMLGHWEKALFIMGKACLEDMTNTDNLNNYAAFLSMTGAEHAAIPILQYLNDLYPDNSTILNNMGQAWFGLGDLANSKKYLDIATSLYDNHSLANATLSNIYQSEGNSAKAIAALKSAIKESYDPEKEHELNRLGVNLTYADLPELNYPMKQDPLHLVELINTFPENYPSRIGDDEKVNVIDRYLNGVKKLREEINNENQILKKKVEQESKRLAVDSAYRHEYLEAHNIPAYKLAARSLQLIIAERFGGASPLPTQSILAGFHPFGKNENIKTESEVMAECERIWRDSVLDPVAALALAMREGGHGNPNCSQVDAVTNVYMAKKAEIYRNGTNLIKQQVSNNKKQLTNWCKTFLYGTVDTPPDDTDELARLLIGNLAYTLNKKRLQNHQLDYFLSMAEKIVERQEYIKSSCNPGAEDKPHTEDADDLHPLKVDLDCEFKKVVNVPAVVYTFTCNTKKEVPKGLKKRKPNVQKGSASNSKRRSQNRNRRPANNRRGGPSAFYYDWSELENADQKNAPLNAEDKDPSQFTLEYDKWGNIIDIKFQLNEEGTALADPESWETEVDSRWTWNAAGSVRKGYLNKVLVNAPAVAAARKPKADSVASPEQPLVINHQLPKTDSVKQARNDIDYSKINICTARDDDDVLVSPRSIDPIYEPLPGIKQNGDLDYTSSRKDALSLDTRYMWNPGDTITVGMDLTTFNTSALVASKVQAYAKVWETVANIHFKFIPDYTKAYVRIGFDPKGGINSMRGTQALFFLNRKYTMNLAFTDDMFEETFRRHILHEFGHVLGFIHEHQSPAGGILWNVTAVFDHYRSLNPPWTIEQINQHIFTKYSSTHTNSSIFDPNSIMNYTIRPEFTLNGYSSTTPLSLSNMDKEFAKMVYPHPFDPDNKVGTLLTGDDCDSIDFSVEYYVAGVDPNFIDFILEPGTNQQGKAVTWWKKIGIPLMGGFEMDLEIINGSVSNKRVQVDLIDKTRGMSFSKAKLLGVHTPLSKKWNVFPALRGGCRVRLTWRNDTCQ